jgi:lipopolysaccharide biosynthesis glycosyltransferase
MIEVASAIDTSYVPWLATMMRSCVVRNAGARLRFHILHGGDVSPHDERRLTLMVADAGSELALHPIDRAQLERLPVAGGRVIWLRMLLPELLPDVSRVLYLDSDTLVVDSIQPLWGTSLDGAPVAAVANVVEPAQWTHIADLGIDDPRQVFNSGVLLLDLDRLREERSFDEVLDRVAGRLDRRFVWPDQDALNVVFAGRWMHLHPRWNAQNSLWTWSEWARDVFGAQALTEATTSPAILHFEGPHICKPWHYLSQHPWTEQYRRVHAGTPWGDTALADETWATRLIGRFPRGRQVPAFIALLRWRSAMVNVRRALQRVAGR